MSLRKTLSSLAAATLVAATVTVTAPVATAQVGDPAELFRQSAEPVAQSSFEVYQSLFDSPVTAPSAVGSFLSSMSWQYLIYCPIAQRIGLEEPYSPNCTF